jgi:hypothetical protein
VTVAAPRLWCSTAMKRVSLVSLVSLVVGVAVAAAGCCCPCAYAATGGVPDVVAAVRPELAPPALSR